MLCDTVRWLERVTGDQEVVKRINPVLDRLGSSMDMGGVGKD